MDTLLRADRRVGRGVVGWSVEAEIPLDSVLERILGMLVLLWGPVRDASPLLAPTPLRTGVLVIRVSSLGVGDPGAVPSRRSISLSFLHLEQRLGAGLGRGEVGGDRTS